MKKNVAVAGALLVGSSALAAEQVPDICKAVANYAAQTLDQTFEDGTWTDGVYSPPTLTLKADTATYPITGAKLVGDCEEQHLPAAWCQVAGGAPVVYEVDFAKKWSATTAEPFASVMVTYNRGGCWVDQVNRK